MPFPFPHFPLSTFLSSIAAIMTSPAENKTDKMTATRSLHFRVVTRSSNGPHRLLSIRFRLITQKGIYFWTPEGKRFIDFNSQLMCVNIGHGDERVIRAINEQASKLPYANPFMATEVRARLAAKLAQITPGDIDAFFFTNGGAESTENAIRIARIFSGRHKIGARYRSYHGGTAGSLTLTGDPRRWAAEPGIPGVFSHSGFLSWHSEGL
jgi:4-aminobutyrate aminotransferase-like enzyme